MNEIHFNEEQLGNLHAIGQTLFDGDSSDPRSWNYQRVLLRPCIRWWKIALCFLLWAGGGCGLFFLFLALSVPPVLALSICAVGMATVPLLWLKRMLICLVRIYQRVAPASVRNKCRFEPSCSQYMIRSLQKYGVRKGLRKGIDRLRRCNMQGGGFDEP